METIPFLRQIPLFAELDDVTLRRLAERCVRRSVASGVVLFTAGEAYRGLYMVESGRVRIYRLSPDGREQVLHIEGPGRTVAELPLFDGGPYPASAVTLEESSLLFLPRADFDHELATWNPTATTKFVEALPLRQRRELLEGLAREAAEFAFL